MRKGCALVGLSVVAAALAVGFVGAESAIAAPDPMFKPILSEIKQKTPSGWTMRLPSQLDGTYSSVIGIRDDLEGAVRSKNHPELVIQNGILSIQFTQTPGCRSWPCLTGNYIGISPGSNPPPKFTEFPDMSDAKNIVLSSGVNAQYLSNCSYSDRLTTKVLRQVVRWKQDEMNYWIVESCSKEGDIIETASSMSSEPPIVSASKPVEKSTGKPSAEQLRYLESELRQMEKSQGSPYPKGEVLNRIREYQKAWAKIYPKTANMFGEWVNGNKGRFSVYPTARPDQVCLTAPFSGAIQIGTVRGNTITYGHLADTHNDLGERTGRSVYDKPGKTIGTVTIYNLSREAIIGVEFPIGIEFPYNGSQKLTPFISRGPGEEVSHWASQLRATGCFITPSDFIEAASSNKSPGISASKPVGKPIPSPKPIVPVIAKPTYPFPQNLAQIAKQKPSGKPPSKTEEKARDNLRKQWKPKNPLVTPFIGGWEDPNGEEIFIYPSTQEKRICSVRAIGDKYDIQHHIVMGNTEGKDVLIGKTKQLFSLGKPNVLAIRDSKTSPLRQLVAIPGSPDLSAGDAGELERRGCIASLPGGTAGTIAIATPNQNVTEVTCRGETQTVRMISVEVKQSKGSTGTFEVDEAPNKSCDEKPIKSTKRHIFFKEIQNPPNPERTWIVIHGWNNNSGTKEIDDLAKRLSKLKQLKNDRVLMLDWGESAFTGLGTGMSGVYYAATWIRPIAETAVNELRTTYGINASEASEKLILVGHSLGSLMSAEMGAVYMNQPANAKSIHANPVVRAIIVLDPPSEKSINDFGGYDLDIRTPGRIIKGKKYSIVPENIERPKDFARVAKFSRSFVGSTSIAGNKEFSSTAHESFLMETGGTRPVGLGSEHGEVVASFATILEDNGFGGLLGPNDLTIHKEIKKEKETFGLLGSAHLSGAEKYDTQKLNTVTRENSILSANSTFFFKDAEAGGGLV
jgi:pimeloyl-ACP methyl ester carboxylesterase